MISTLLKRSDATYMMFHEQEHVGNTKCQKYSTIVIPCNGGVGNALMCTFIELINKAHASLESMKKHRASRASKRALDTGRKGLRTSRS